MKKINLTRILNCCKTILLITIALVLFFSCEKELKTRPDDFPPMLVLNGIVYQDSIFHLNVTRTGGLNETFMIDDLFVTDAIVSLYDEDIFLEFMEYDSLGFYSSTSLAVGGHSYSIIVEKDDYPTAKAYVDFSNEPEIEIINFSLEKSDSIYTYDFPEPASEILLYEFIVNYDLRLSDNAEEINFYSFSALTKTQDIMHYNNGVDDEEIHLNELMYKNVSVHMRNWNVWQKYNQKYYGSDEYSFSAIDDKMFNGQTETFNLYTFFRTSEVGDYSIIVKSYPESIVRYYESVELYQDIYDSPYSEPVNIYSNVENGVGFVCGIPSSKIVFEIE
jgi:hypothetical protein